MVASPGLVLECGNSSWSLFFHSSSIWLGYSGHVSSGNLIFPSR